METTTSSQSPSSSSNDPNGRNGIVSLPPSTTTNNNTSSELPFLITHWLNGYSQQHQQQRRIKNGNFISNNKKRNQSSKGTNEEDVRTKEALARVRKATSELASAFADLGAFGQSQNNNNGTHSDNNPMMAAFLDNIHTTNNATYTDMTRRWNNVPQDHLQTLLHSSTVMSNSVMTERMTVSSQFPHCRIHAAYERFSDDGATNDGSKKLSSSPDGKSKNTAISIQDGMTNTTTNNNALQQENSTLATTSNETQIIHVNNMLLHNPILLSVPTNMEESKEAAAAVIENSNNTNTTLTIRSNYHQMDILSSNASRRVVDIKRKLHNEIEELKQLQHSLLYQKNIYDYASRKINEYLSSATATSARSASAAATSSSSTTTDSDSYVVMQNEANRVIAQLNININSKTRIHQKTKSELSIAEAVSNTLWNETQHIKHTYIDPSYDYSCTYEHDYTTTCTKSHKKRNSMLSHVVSRSIGIGSILGNKRNKFHNRRKIGMKPTTQALIQRYEALMTATNQRLGHYVTVNCHLDCPVYCLRFDRTGQYFVTGADDNLVKLFRIGLPHHEDVRQQSARKIDCSRQRGAILVCTLRGHASVITDIDISADNALIATASEDGDVRIWGMTDGCPIAILRGHTGGANMVSWSTLTPYRIVTVGQDGLARIWDIRQAALKRCKTVRSRIDYTLPKIDSQNENESDLNANPIMNRNRNINGNVENDENIHNDVILPPLPVRLNNINASSGIEVSHNSNQAGPNQVQNNNVNNNNVFVPPLPAGAEQGVGAQDVPNNGDRPGPGVFVANDEIDEGVSLLSKLQHGVASSSDQIGSQTRSSRKKVNVLCITRCPIGGHFATGSDDGLGRIWADEDDRQLQHLDVKLREYNSRFAGKCHTDLLQSHLRDPRTRSSNVAPSTARLLATLHGHHKAITDIKYSNEGDRLLTASQKDGVVRIWSWGNETTRNNDGISIEQVRQIYLRMAPPQPQQESTINTNPRRRRSASSSKPSMQVNCDMATWTSDDSKVITSQCCLSSPNGTDIVPESQIIYVWDSRTGHCLLGFPSAHEQSCSVILPHPIDPSIIVSAGEDGVAKVWSLRSGKCLFTHHNKRLHSSPESPLIREKHFGYHDGSFSPDGLTIVLTDDGGSFSIIDTKMSADEEKPPICMKEQYFANDYYELFYDTNGYCIDRGSRQPPHLAPTAARCNHTGSPYDSIIQDAYCSLYGPKPVCQEAARVNRDDIRQRSFYIRRQGGILAQNVHNTRTLIEAYPSASSHITDKVCDRHKINPNMTQREIPPPLPPPLPQPSNNGSNRQLSNRYRWIGYEDTLQDDDMGDNALSDNDENYENYDDLSPSRPRQQNNRNTNRSRRRNNRNNIRHEVERFEEIVSLEPTRTSARQSSRRPDPQMYEDEDSDDSAFEQMLSTNTNPMEGKYVSDYNDLGHTFKLPSGSNIKRKLVSRLNCIEGYIGQKTYAPQVGDSVVYVPRAHSDTLKAFPICNSSSKGAPWKSWQTNSPWPVVQCEVKAIRYRFPYVGYFGRNCENPINSIVMILTLELTGIPVNDPDREYPWPKPEFISRPTTRSSTVFDVSVFENDEVDFIVPLQLYIWRLQQIEHAAQLCPTKLYGVEVMDNYFDPNQGEDEKFQPFKCVIARRIRNADEDEFHFQLSGTNSLIVDFENGDNSIACPWDLNVCNPSCECPLPSCLTESQKRETMNILEKLEEDEDVLAMFCAPVDTRRYVDYLQMIEVPMDFSVIRKRIKSNYYTNVRSVKADIMLVYDNCIKYNQDDTDVAGTADKMMTEFNDLFQKKLEHDQLVTGIRDISELNNSKQSQEDDLLEFNSDLQEAGDKKNPQVSGRGLQSTDFKIRVRIGDTEISDTEEPNESDKEYINSDEGFDGDDDFEDDPDDLDDEDTDADTPIRRSSRRQGAKKVALNHNGQMKTSSSNHKEEDSFEDDSDDLDDEDTDNDANAPIRRSSRRQAAKKVSLNQNGKMKTSSSNRKEEEDEDIKPMLKRKRRSDMMVHSSSLENLKDKSDSDESGNIRGTRRSSRQKCVSSPKQDKVASPRRSSRRNTQDSAAEETSADNKIVAKTNSEEVVPNRRISIRLRGIPRSSTSPRDSPVEAKRVQSQRDKSSRLLSPKIDQTKEKRTSPRRAVKKATSYEEFPESHYENDDEESNNGFKSTQKLLESRGRSRRTTDRRKNELENIESGQKSPRRSTRTSRRLNPHSSPEYDEDQLDDLVLSEEEDAFEAEISEEEVFKGKKKPRQRRKALSGKITNERTPSGQVRIRASRVVNNAMSATPNSHELNSSKLGRSSRRSKRNRDESPLISEDAQELSVVEQQSPTRRRSSRGLAPSTYQDLSNSEVDDETSDDNNDTSPTRRRKVRKSPARSKPKPKRQKVDKSSLYPAISKWPVHHIKGEAMQSFCVTVLDKMIANDAEAIFLEPVIEAHPEIKDKYLKKIDEPMDFATIRTRIPDYRVISDLQNDLVLVFRNCCDYNAINSPYWKYALEMWKHIDVAFKEAHDEHNIQLPRRYAV